MMSRGEIGIGALLGGFAEFNPNGDDPVGEDRASPNVNALGMSPREVRAFWDMH